VSYDVIIIGAGHNGLAAAAWLARAGRTVAVVERSAMVGGLAAGEEFHPGYRSAGLLHDTTGVRAAIVRELDLERFGLRLRREPPAMLLLGVRDAPILLPGDPQQRTQAIGTRMPRDAEQYARYTDFLARIAAALDPFLNGPPADLVDPAANGGWELLRRGLRLRRLGRRDMLELLRLPPLAAADWLAEWFETDWLQATLALPAVAGNFMGPRSPGSTGNLLLQACAAGPGVEGGAPALVKALEAAARAHRADIHTSANVTEILLGDTVRGVRLESGEELQAPVVAASCHPRQLFLNLVPRRALSFRLAHRIETYRSRGTTAQVLFALRAPLHPAAGAELPAASDGAFEFAHTARSLDDIERAFDAIKYRRIPERPILEIHVPSAVIPEHCPPGHAVVSVHVHFVPYDLEPGWGPEERERLGDRVQEIIGEHCGTLDVVARYVLAPPDLEARYALPGGNIHHGEHSLDQLLVRPVPECSRYGTPIPGLFLSGGGSHPGGGLTCMPGTLAARAILAA
jgi:phytoene dehydrogenase-like protein